MAVRIRLQRVGRKNRPYYRFVVADARSRRNGKCLDRLGYYDTTTDPPVAVVDLKKLDEWVAKGAQMTDVVSSLVKCIRRKQNLLAAQPSTEPTAVSVSPGEMPVGG